MVFHKLGTNYGGWIVPIKIELNENSTIYSGGVGEDISFDLILSDKYNCNIYLIDPTKRSIKHYNEIKNYYEGGLKISEFSGDIQVDYERKIKNLTPNFDKFNYIQIGLWDKKEELKFYKPTNKQYVSHTLIDNMYSKKFEIVNVNNVKEIMEENNHTHIDLMKLDIEGAEIKTINQMLDDNIFPTYLLVEFDLFLKNKDKNNETNKLIKRLSRYYNILINDNYNITFKKL